MPVIPTSIFISYSRTDSSFIDRLEADLQARNFHTWVDRTKLQGGQEWLDEIQNAIDQCQVLLVVLSPESVGSRFVKMEYRYAQRQNKLVIPLEYQPCPKVPMELNDIQWVSFKKAYDLGLQDLLKALSPFETKASDFVMTLPAPPPSKTNFDDLDTKGVKTKVNDNHTDIPTFIAASSVPPWTKEQQLNEDISQKTEPYNVIKTYEIGYSPNSQPTDSYSIQPYGQQSGYSQREGYQWGGYGQLQYGHYLQPYGRAQVGPYGPTSTGLNGRTEALLSYILGWFSGLIFFLIERKNRFVRFHAAQSFIFFGIVSVVYIVIRLLGIIPIVGFLLSPVLGSASFIVLIPAALIWVLLMIQAYRGVTIRLPIVSGYAESLVTRFSPKKKSTI